MTCRLPAEIGALVIKALDAAVNDLPVRDVSAETSAQQSAGGLVVQASDERPSWGVRRGQVGARLSRVPPDAAPAGAYTGIG